MYYPYFRGKQYDLITIRDNAKLLSENNFIPIIEPVKEATNGLKRTLDSVIENDGKVILISNPENGELTNNNDPINKLLDDYKNDNIIIGILLSEDRKKEYISELINKFFERKIAFIHSGYSDANDLLSMIDSIDEKNITHVFLDNLSGKVYRRKFREHGNRVLISDGFNKRTNRLHPDVEFFSDLHVIYDEESMNGFGDFLIVGDEFTEAGGPAYAIAIHLTFIDPSKDSEMHVYHFKSDRTDTPADPAGKFMEALNKLVDAVQKKDSKILKTSAITEFLTLHEKKHFPGLGSVKKISMQHHIETLASYLAKK